MHPRYIDLESRGGLGWLEGFNEWMVRCGLEFAGHPGTDEFINSTGDTATMDLTLHGKVGNIPASEVAVSVDPQDHDRIKVSGVVYESFFNGPKLSLQAELSTVPGSRSFRIADRITNHGAEPQEFQIIYHANFGAPLLEPDARVWVAAKRVQPMNDHAAKSLDGYHTYGEPTAGFVEQVYLLETHADQNGGTLGVASKCRRRSRGDNAMVGQTVALPDDLEEHRGGGRRLRDRDRAGNRLSVQSHGGTEVRASAQAGAGSDTRFRHRRRSVVGSTRRSAGDWGTRADPRRSTARDDPVAAESLIRPSPLGDAGRSTKLSVFGTSILLMTIMGFRFAALWLLLSGFTLAGEIDFNRDIRPILSDNCFACHGFDENSRAAGLRLDELEGATEDLGGYAAIVPGDPDNSAVIERITSDDEDLLMPPPDSHKKRLDDKSVLLLRRWIAEGAAWGKHWAFERPVKAEVDPNTHPVDFFVNRKLGDEEMAPAERAKISTLARRLSFDLTGLPATPEMIESLGDQPTDDDWLAFIDVLLDSPHYGERMAMWWLDGARYSDTDGFQQDAVRTNWPWRDWVVDAFNRNMPFDQFTVQQFAGDLLPDATAEQILATCFHRNHMNNGEGGRDPEESRVDYVIDRVNTMGTLWLGLTLGCTQCHDHKFDPISQYDYYSLSAYFDSIDETGKAGGGAGPFQKYRSPLAKRAVEESEQLLKESEKTLAAVRSAAEADADPWIAGQVRRVLSGFQPWLPIVPHKVATKEGYRLRVDGDMISTAPSQLPQDDFIITAPPVALQRITGFRLDVFPDPSHTDGKLSHSDSGEFILTNVKLQVRKRGTSQIREIALASAVADVNGKGVDTKYANVSGTLDDDPRTGWTTRTKPADQPHHAVFALAEPLVLQPDEQLDIILMQRSLDPRALIGRFRLSVTDQAGQAVRSLDPMPLEQLADSLSGKDSAADAEVSGELRKRLIAQFLEDHREYQLTRRRHDRVVAQHNEIKRGAGELNVMVLKERDTPRKTHVLQRGVWDKKGEQVSVGVLPAVLPADPSEVPTRLELGRWVVSEQNPLTARVITNQIWQLFFGAGLVPHAERFRFAG